MRVFDVVTRAAFGLASVALMLLAFALIVYAGMQVIEAYRQPDADVGSTLLEAVGYTVIAIAVFDVAIAVLAIAALAIFQFLWVWNDLLVALILLQDPDLKPDASLELKVVSRREPTQEEVAEHGASEASKRVPGRTEEEPTMSARGSLPCVADPDPRSAARL